MAVSNNYFFVWIGLQIDKVIKTANSQLQILL